MDLRYQIHIDGKLRMATTFISDLHDVICFWMSIGKTVKVIDTLTGREWVNKTGEQIADEQTDKFFTALEQMKTAVAT